MPHRGLVVVVMAVQEAPQLLDLYHVRSEDDAHVMYRLLPRSLLSSIQLPVEPVDETNQ